MIQVTSLRPRPSEIIERRNRVIKFAQNAQVPSDQIIGSRSLQIEQFRADLKFLNELGINPLHLDKKTSQGAVPEGASIVVVGGSSLTYPSKAGVTNKISFEPKSAAEYLDLVISAATSNLSDNKLSRNRKNVLLLPIAGGVSEEGAKVFFTDNFQTVKNDFMSNEHYRQYYDPDSDRINLKLALEDKFRLLSFEVDVRIYNDTIPSTLEVEQAMRSDNPTAVKLRKELIEVLHSGGQIQITKPLDELSIAEQVELLQGRYTPGYAIVGSGYGMGAVDTASGKPFSQERGHAVPSLEDHIYKLNPFLKYMTENRWIQPERSLEKLISGGRAGFNENFTEILNKALKLIKRDDSGGIRELIFESLGIRPSEAIGSLILNYEKNISLKELGENIQKGDPLAIAFGKAFAKAVGSAIACAHYLTGPMPDGISIVRKPATLSAIYATRRDGSALAMLNQHSELAGVMNQAAKEYASHAAAGQPHLFEIVDLKELRPNSDPDFGGLPQRAKELLETQSK